MSANRKFNDEDREQRRAQDRERLKDAAEQLLSSEGWQRWPPTWLCAALRARRVGRCHPAAAMMSDAREPEWSEERVRRELRAWFAEHDFDKWPTYRTVAQGRSQAPARADRASGRLSALGGRTRCRVGVSGRRQTARRRDPGDPARSGVRA